MPFQSTLSRGALAVVVLLSLAFLAHAAPVATNEAGKQLTNLEARGTHCFGNDCFGGLDLVSMLKQLQGSVDGKLKLLDGTLKGGDPATVIAEIEGLILAAAGAVKGYNIGLLGLLTGKLLIIVKLVVAILLSIVTHLTLWTTHPDFAVILGLVVKLDLALKLLLAAILDLGGILGGVLGLVVGLLTPVQVGLLEKLQFLQVLGLLGLGGL